MAKIPLRAYVQEIENLIERGEIDPAIAHAKNILKTYPKSIDTYRILGKAYLESQRYTQALDILQRVLSVIPDDFISQIGMSIIREDEGNLDQSIWHMERAYEVQPFNPAVQDELRRLYGRRDGVQPPKIRLTRGALVRMYARGELYPQAIAETLAALAEDPNRTDLEVLLARLYYLSNQKIEAIEACSRLLKQIPYCKEAIEILTRVLPETNRASDAPYYLQRLYTLDPYAAFISPNAQTSDQVPEQAVMVEQFNLDMSMAEMQTPEWTQNVGIQWEETEAEDLPDWLNTLKPGQDTATSTGATTFTMDEPSTPAEEPESTLEQPAQPAGELMPDFLKDAGWTQTDRRADDIMKESLMQESGEEEAAAPAEIPDWLQSIAPQAGSGAQEEDERTDWLDSILPSDAADNGKAVPAAQVDEPIMVDGLDDDITAADLPDWLSTMDQDTESPAPAALSSDTQDWLSETAPAQEETTQPQAEQSLDWLSGMEQPAQQEAGDSDTPDWLASLATPADAQSEAVDESAAPAGDMPDWLKGLEQQPDDAQPLNLGDDTFAMPEAAEQEMPATSLPAAEEAAGEVPGVPDWLQSLGTEDQPADAAQESTAWMTAFEEGVEPEAKPIADETSESAAADIPEWMQGLAPTEDEKAEAESVLFETPAAETLEAAPVEAAPVGDMPDMNDMDATMAWLETLAAKQGADEATLLISNPEQRSETPPDWLQEAAAAQEMPAAQEPDAGQEQPAVPDMPAVQELPAADLPADGEPNQPEAAGTTPTDLQDWLAGLAAAEQAETVSAAEGVEEFIPGREQETVETDLPSIEELPAAVGTEQAAPEAETGQPDLSDMDATMAWLEGLAAKQGADEATLITPPDQRSETPPDWVQEAADGLSATDELPATESLPVDAETGGATEASATDAVAADLPDWLQELEQPEANQPDEQTASTDTGFARIFDAPEQDVEPVVMEQPAEAVWPVDSFAGDQMAQEAAAMPIAADTQPETVEAQPDAAEVPPTAAPSEMPDLSDMDSAMAWLESLAAKQGADEGTLLISSPDQRSETPPEWIQNQAAEGMPAEPAHVEAEAEPNAEPALSEIETPEWLSELEQPTAETTADAAADAVAEAEVVWPVDSFAGDEIAQEAVTLPADEPEETTAPIMAEAATITDTVEASIPVPEPTAAEMPDMNDMDAAMAWLEALAAKQGADEATLLITDPEQRSETPPEWISKQTGELKLPEEQAAPEEAQAESLPDWLRESEVEDVTLSPAEKTQPLATTSETPVSTEPSSMTDETAAWLESLNTGGEEPATEQVDAPPEPAESGGEFMPQWLTSLEEESETVGYATLEDETTTVPVDISSAWMPEEAAPETSLRPAGEEAPALLSLPDLQAALRRGDLDRALDGYSQLIQSDQMLDETIHDLRDALYRYPVDIMIWQTLGDAYSRNNQLQEALDAYTKAEELLR